MDLLADMLCAGFELASSIYINTSQQVLPLARVEQVILDKAMEAYDGASNGNRTRGGVKRANDMYDMFSRHQVPILADYL